MKSIKDNLVVRGIAAIIAAIALVMLFSFLNPDLKSVGDKYKNEVFCIVADDRSYIEIDTDPFDIGNHITDGSIEAIKDINKQLGLPESVYAQMEGTRALDGTQTYEKDGISVSWTFHPDSGLEVIYSAK